VRSTTGRTLIVGAGPAGLALAVQLARRHCPVSLLEARPALGGSFRGEALMPSGLEALERLELLPPSGAVPQRPLTGWSFWLQGRPLFGVEEPMGSAHACTLMDPETLLIDWAERLQRLPAAELLLGRGVSGLIHSDPGGSQARVTGVRLNDGQQLQADLVVACDGRGSSLRRDAGLELTGAAPAIDVLWFRLGGPAAEVLAERLAGRFHTLIGDEGSMALYASTAGGVQLGWPLQSGQRLARSSRQWQQLWLSNKCILGSCGTHKLGCRWCYLLYSVETNYLS